MVDLSERTKNQIKLDIISFDSDGSGQGEKIKEVVGKLGHWPSVICIQETKNVYYKEHFPKEYEIIEKRREERKYLGGGLLIELRKEFAFEKVDNLTNEYTQTIRIVN